MTHPRSSKFTKARGTDPLVADAAARASPLRQRAAPGVNNAATAALMAGAADNKSLVDDARANKAIAELTRT